MIAAPSLSRDARPTLQLQRVSLRVADLERSLAFYARQVGFAVLRQTKGKAELAPGKDWDAILTLEEATTAEPAPASAAGLFHAALRFPSRAALGAWLRGAAERDTEFDGLSDHAVSEAIYFSDPDGNGLEFYADRPPATWPRSGDQIEMVTLPLDLDALLEAALPGQHTLAGTGWGHLHLRVTNLERSTRFYHELLGLDVTQRTFPGACFMAVDHYHHHLGLNVWGRPTKPQPPDALGLIEATFGQRSLATGLVVRDPDGIAIRVTPLR